MRTRDSATRQRPPGMMRSTAEFSATAPAGSRAASQAASSGLRVLEEAFCDRRYEPSGELASRARPDALISSPTLAAAQAARLATEGLLLEGRARPVQMLCVHSDSPGVLGLLAAVRTALLAAGVSIAPLG